jgi:hypothetical protein
MQRLLIVVIMFVSCVALADDTQLLLDATRVDHNILLALDGKVVRFTTDDGRRSGTIDTARTFAGTDGFDVLFQNYNPLQLSVTATEKKEAEPNTKSAEDFLGLLTDTLKIIPGLGGAPGGTGVSAVTIQTCADARQVAQQAATQLAKLADVTLDQKQRDTWVKGANGRTGVQNVRDSIKTFVGDLNAKITNAKNAQQALRDLGALRGKLESARTTLADQIAKADATPAGQKAKATATTKLKQTEELLACWPDTITTLAAANSIIDSHQKLADALTALVLALDALDNDAKWAGNNFIVLRTETQPEIQDTITVKITPLTLDENGSITSKTEGLITRDIILREYRRFVPEFGVAGIYSDLRYPKYNVKDDAGKKVVAANGFDTANVNAAATMNLFCNCLGGHTLYPGFQLGISKAKDYPGLMAGIALRFAGVKRISIATGRMVTWYKDLNKLQVGSEVGSENDINADLKLRRAKTAWYLGAQLTF